jgi:hypothetical protein
MYLTPEEEAVLPSQEDVVFYRQHGWYRSKRVLPDALLDHALTGIQRHFSGQRDWMLPPTSGFSDRKPGDGNIVRNAEVVALQNAEVRRLALHPILGAIAARLIRRRLAYRPSLLGHLHVRQPTHDVDSVPGLHDRDGTAAVCRR